MISKGFLSGIFSVVSFMLITTLAIPSTFGACPIDVSGTWVVKVRGVRQCCSNPIDNGLWKWKGEIPVTQTGDEISASWVLENGNPVVLTGIVNGTSVYCKLEGTYPEKPGCGSVEDFVGLIFRKGTRIIGLSSGEETCDTCRYFVFFKIKIVK